MYAKKQNKRYTITEAEKKGYQARGYDIYDDDGNLVEVGAGKTVSYAKYQQALDKIKELKKKLKSLENSKANKSKSDTSGASE